MIPEFPQEIHDSIIACLRGDTPSLLACALVCKSFVPMSQRLLFSQVDLKWVKHKPAPGYRFRQLLASAPHIAGYVRELKITNGCTRDFDYEKPGWVAHDNSLQNILPALSNLKAITFTAKHTSWEYLSRRVQEALLSAFRSDSLIYLHLKGISDFPITTITEFGGLKHLRLSSLHYLGPFPTYEGLCPPYPGHPPTSYPNLNLFILMYNPRSCRLYSTDFFAERAFTTKVSVSGSVRYLTLPPHKLQCPSHLGDDNEFTRIHQSPLPHLRKVSIQLELQSLFAMSENALLSVASLLHSNKIATLPRLEELAFSCNGADIDNLRAPFDMSVWKALDARAHQLSGKSFRALNVDVFHPEGYLSNGIIRMISRNLP
jgi:hypothetical protein